MRMFCLFLYYSVAQYFPTQPVPTWRFGYFVRRLLVKRIFAVCGDRVIIKQRAYFGGGRTLKVGNRAQLGMNSRIDRDVSIGDDVVMGPDVVIMTSGHA